LHGEVGATEIGQGLAWSDMVDSLRSHMAARGLSVHEEPQHELVGEVTAIRAKWWFGGRTVTYRMSCRLTEADHTVHVREAVIERAWGIPPPTFGVETTTVRGWKLSGRRADVSTGGGGSLDYASARESVERASAEAGWTFDFEGGRMP
jgi:hypothetical protein